MSSGFIIIAPPSLMILRDLRGAMLHQEAAPLRAETKSEVIWRLRSIGELPTALMDPRSNPQTAHCPAPLRAETKSEVIWS